MDKFKKKIQEQAKKNQSEAGKEPWIRNRAGQRFYPLYMRPIIQRIDIAGYFLVPYIFDREGIGKDRIFGLLMVEPPDIIRTAALQIDFPLPQGIGSAGP